MTILQRYGIFVGFPGTILLLAVGLMLVSTDADDEDSSDTNLDLKGATVIVVESPEKEAQDNQITGSPANEQPQAP